MNRSQRSRHALDYERSGGGLTGYTYQQNSSPVDYGGRASAYWGYPEGGDHPETGARGREREAPESYGGWQRVKENVRKTFAGKGPKGFARADSRILEDVCELLTEHPEVDATDIEVSVEDGEVTLAGLVTDRRQKRLAEDIADEVMGVRDVHNRICIQRPAEEGQTVSGSGAQAVTGSHTWARETH